MRSERTFSHCAGGPCSSTGSPWALVLSALTLLLCCSHPSGAETPRSSSERLLDDALQAYADGLGRGGASVEFADVQRGFHAAVALRWKLAVDVVAGLETGEAPRRGSLPDEPPEAAVDELVQLVDILLAAAGRALD